MTALDLPLPPPAPFEVPPALVATEPPEARGLQRDEVRLLVAGDGPISHRTFRDLGAVLRAGDLLVVNTSATLPAAVDGWRADGRPVTVHFSGSGSAGAVVVELRGGDLERVTDAHVGERLTLPDGVTLVLAAAWPDPSARHGSRLWQARLRERTDVGGYLDAVGRPIAYDHLRGRWPLEAYQTIFARDPGSAEMPSAARPFSPRVLTDLVMRGVLVAPLTLHAGVSSLEAGETPLPERFTVPAATARLVNDTRAGGARVIAVGTTVARALETVAGEDGTVAPGEGWTDLVLGPGRPARVLDGLVTGWHEPETSHLLLLQAVAGADLVERAYTAALATGYRWHEFGDACLLLAPPRVPAVR